MRVEIFGKGDQIAIPAQHALLGIVSPDIAYTHPSLEICYSQYGFAYPVDMMGLPLAVVLGKKLPISTDFIKGDLKCDYILVDHYGRLWRLGFTWGDDDVKSVSHTFLDHINNGWWMNIPIGNEPNFLADIHALQGFLYTNPSVDKINEYWQKYQGNTELTWLSVKDIVAKLNKDYPHEKEKVT